MGLRREGDETYHVSDYPFEEEYEQNDPEEVNRKKYLRRKLEDRLEKKRLKEEFDELDGDFDWDELDK